MSYKLQTLPDGKHPSSYRVRIAQDLQQTITQRAIKHRRSIPMEVNHLLTIALKHEATGILVLPEK